MKFTNPTRLALFISFSIIVFISLIYSLLVLLNMTPFQIVGHSDHEWFSVFIFTYFLVKIYS